MADQWEKEGEYFGIHPLVFTERVANITHDVSCDMVDALERYLIERCEQEHEDQLIPTVTESSDKLMEVLQNEIDKNMDKFELYVLRNILKLPNNFEEMKEEEEMKKKEVSVEDTDELMRSEEDELIHLDQNLNAEIEELRKQVVAAKYCNAVLESQKERSQVLRNDFERLNQFADSVKLNVDVHSNELTGDVKSVLKSATTVHSILTGAREVRLQRESESSDPSRNEPEIVNQPISGATALSSDQLKALSETL